MYAPPRRNVTKFMMSYYIYGKLLRLEKCVAPVNVATHHNCINRKFATNMDSQ